MSVGTHATPSRSSGLNATGLATSYTRAVDITAPLGQCTAIMGPSGAGKSTLLRMLADLIPHQGQTWLNNADQQATPAPAWRQQVCYLAAEAGWWGATVNDHFNCQQDQLEPLLQRLSLASCLLQSAPDELSTGERQRMALVRAITNNPTVLLLDEPTSALDATTTDQVESLLGEWLNDTRVLILSSHSSGQVSRLAHSTITLKENAYG